MEHVLNEVTNTVHRHEPGTADLQTACGVTFHLSHDNLSTLTASETTSASKCGRCFDDGGGY